MKKIIAWFLLVFSVFVLSACLPMKSKKDFWEVVTEKTDNLVISDKGNIVQVTLPKDYTFNGQAEIESISYGNIKRETYILLLAEPKEMVSAETMEDYFDIVSPKLDNAKVEELSWWVISNPHWYKVKDYKVSGSYNGIDLVWFQRILEQDNYFAQYNAWTLASNLSGNQSELFSDIASFEWKDGANVVTKKEKEEYLPEDETWIADMKIEELSGTN